MFEATIEEKKIAIQAQLMDNRLKRLQYEEDRAKKKINQTIERTKNYERIRKEKDDDI